MDATAFNVSVVHDSSPSSYKRRKSHGCTYLQTQEVLTQSRTLLVLALSVEALHLDEFVSVNTVYSAATTNLPNMSRGAVNIHS